jgi:hypothetical protein
MFEVYSGHKPGRKNLAVLLSGGVLIAALSMAWLQARSRLTLGDPVQISGAKLWVRPPKGWVEDEPGTFVLISKDGRRESINRRVHISAGRERMFESPYPTSNPRVTRVDPIGGLFALEQELTDSRRVLTSHGPREYTQTIIIRKAVSPRGDFILVEYEPLSVASAGDHLLLDAICAEIRFDEPALNVNPDQALRDAGVEFPLDSDWHVAAPGKNEPSGLYIGPAAGGKSFWSLGVFRTRLDSDDLKKELERFVGRRGVRLAPSFLEYLPPIRSDGVDAVGVLYGGQKSFTRSFWMASAGETQSVLIIAFATPDSVDDANRAAQRVAETIRFTSGAPVTAASLAELVRQLHPRARP